MLSNELQMGKAGEYLTCYRLLMQGYSVFTSDQGLNYDLVLDINGQLKRIQVKTTRKLVNTTKVNNIYRFALKSGKYNIRRIETYSVDYFAFVALDIECVAFFRANKLYNKDGQIKSLIEFKSRRICYPRRVYSNGNIRTTETGKYIEDYTIFRE